LGLEKPIGSSPYRPAQFLGNPEKVLGFKNVQLLVIHVFHRFAHRSVDILALHHPPFLAHLQGSSKISRSQLKEVSG
jgi:hypothetical protein